MVAIQQALVIEFGLSYRQAGKLLGVHHRTVWQHVQARRGANVRSWDRRTAAQKRAAIDAALRLFIVKA